MGHIFIKLDANASIAFRLSLAAQLEREPTNGELWVALIAFLGRSGAPPEDSAFGEKTDVLEYEVLVK